LEATPNIEHIKKNKKKKYFGRKNQTNIKMNYMITYVIIIIISLILVLKCFLNSIEAKLYNAPSTILVTLYLHN